MTKLTFHTEERDDLKKLINRYKCSPFTGKCYTDEVSLVKDKKTGLYHIILTEKQVEKYKIMDEFASKNSVNHVSMTMIQPTEEDNEFLLFRKKLSKQ